MYGLPSKVSQLFTQRFNGDDELCMECGGPSVVDGQDGDEFYVVEGQPFCSIDCVERWHGIELEG